MQKKTSHNSLLKRLNDRYSKFYTKAKSSWYTISVTFLLAISKIEQLNNFRPLFCDVISGKYILKFANPSY